MKRAKVGRRNLMKPVPHELSSTHREAKVPEALAPKPKAEELPEPTDAKKVEPPKPEKAAIPDKTTLDQSTYSIEISLQPTTMMAAKLREAGAIYDESAEQILGSLLKKTHKTFRQMVKDGTVSDLKPLDGERDLTMRPVKARNGRVTQEEVEAAQSVADPLNLKSMGFSLSEIYLRILQKELKLS